MTLTFAPTADSYATNQSGQTTTNFGTAITMAVGVSPTRHTFVKFNVTGLTAAPTSATLKLWAVSASGGASAKSTTTAWTETGINYTNKPAIGATAVSTVGTVTAGTWATFNVTSLIPGNGQVAIAFTSASTTGVTFASREDAAHAPQLTVIAPAGSAPGAPTGVTAVGGNGQANVSWTAPASDGGSPITAYTVTSSPGGLTCGTTGTLTCAVTGLTNGTPYTFTATATNAIGTSPPSAASTPVTPATVPGAPTAVSAVPGNASANVSWTIPASNGGNAIIDYTVTSSPGGITAVASGPAANSALVSGLTNGIAYTFTVHARNSAGNSLESAASPSVTPTATVPDPPTGVGGVAGNASATVSWTIPASNGGSAITGYLVTSSPGNFTGSASGPGATSAVVSGLTNGTPYTFTVHATNSAGNSLESAASSAVTPRTMPDPPTGVSGVAGNASATVSWTAPGSDGGSAITGYTATANPGGQFCSTLGTLNCVVSGLTNGTPYTFTVHATNSAGNSLESAASPSVTPTSAPGAPTGVSAAGGNGQATVSFTAPANDGGNAITGYTATANPGGQFCTASAPPNCLVTGLTNGTSYTFTVTATNGTGTSSPSSPSNAVTPATMPDAPTGVSAVAGNGQATVSWTIPADDGGNAIIDYLVTSSGTQTATATGAGATSAVVTGLTNGTPYTFTVHARNSVGDGAESAESFPVIPLAPLGTAPGAPTGVSAVGGNAQATVSWSAPASDGGNAITGYTATANPGGQFCTASAPPNCLVTGLTNGTSYTFTVTATNGVGTGPASSPSNAVTPATVPDAPTGVGATGGNGQAIVSWSAPASDGGSGITDYLVTSAPGGVTCSSGGSLTCGVSGLANGTSYTFTVHAINGMGPGAESGASNAVTPATVPSAPTGVSAAPGQGQATVSWTIPVSDGGNAIIDYTVTPSIGPPVTVSGASTNSALITGLTNGVAYSFTVHARNSIGFGTESAASPPVTPTATVSGPPTSVSAVAGDAQATVSWSAPVDTGGSPISGYTATSTPVGGNCTASVPPSCTVIGLTNGVAYTFTVHATNGAGNSPEGGPSNSVTPTSTVTVPGAPTNVNAAGGNASATVTWAVPVSNGGGAIIDYTVKSTPGNFTAVATGPSASTATVSGLVNGTSYTFTVHARNSAGNSVESTVSNAVIPTTTPPVFRRQPYLTDTTPTSTLVSFASSTNTPVPVVKWDLGSGNCLNPPNSVTGTFVVSFAGTVSGTTVYQYKATIGGLSPDTAYCYRVFQNGIDLKGAATTFRTAPAVGSTAPFKFAVIGDWGQGTTAEANVFSQMAAGQPNFVMTVGDNEQGNGTNAEYGDLGGGSVFPASYLPKLGGSVPIYAAQGNHGFTTNLPYLQTFPQDATVASSGGKFTQESYCCAAGTTGTNSYPSAWYAFTWGNARFYVLEAAWADSNGGYQGDFTSHWNGPVAGCTPCGQEMTWLQNDLAANASVPLKFAFFHYPLYSDNGASTGGSDTYLNGAAPHLEGVLAASNVNIAFTGHAHFYERNVPMAGGPLITNYITGGGGATTLESPEAGGCDPWDAYAFGGNTSASRRCGAAPYPATASAYHYLLVSVNGSQVTVTPTDMNGATFDVQTYNVTPPTVPSAPTNATAAAGNAQATVNWTIPASSGGSAILDYTVTSNPGNITAVASGATASSVVVPGLTNGTAYTFTVKARNGVGSSPPSAASNSVTPTAPTVPGAPTSASAVAGSGQATVSWTIPASNGGSAILDYTATSSPGGLSATVSGPTATSVVVSGLTNGTAYTFTVRARNAVGSSTPSTPSNSVTPTAPTVPGAPTSPSAVGGNASATVSWTIPASNGGSAILDYTATSSPGGLTATVAGPTATSVVVNGLTNGTAYTFTVRARNSVGSSPPSVPSNSVSPAGAGPPVTFIATADSYVSSAAKTTNFGTQTTMQFGISPTLHAYVMFNVTGSGAITNATLRIWATAAGTGASVHSTTTGWTETGLIYNNEPTYGATLQTVNNFAAGTWLSYNVTSLVTTSGPVAFMWTKGSAGPVTIASREDAAHAPQLIVTR